MVQIGPSGPHLAVMTSGFGTNESRPVIFASHGTLTGENELKMSQSFLMFRSSVPRPGIVMTPGAELRVGVGAAGTLVCGARVAGAPNPAAAQAAGVVLVSTAAGVVAAALAEVEGLLLGVASGCRMPDCPRCGTSAAGVAVGDVVGQGLVDGLGDGEPAA